MTDLEKNICYLCGKEGADTDDHIPPKNIYLKRFKNIGEDLITVKTHLVCNKKYELDDEYFRIFLTAPIIEISDKAKEIWNKKVLKSIKRSEAKKFRNYLKMSVHYIDLYTPSNIYTGTYPSFFADAFRVETEIERIVRGIFYNKTNMIFPLDYHIEISFMPPIKKYLRDKLIFHSFGDKTFQFYWKHSLDYIDGFYWLIFYDEIDFWVFTSKERITSTSGRLPNRT